MEQSNEDNFQHWREVEEQVAELLSASDSRTHNILRKIYELASDTQQVEVIVDGEMRLMFIKEWLNQ